MKVDPHVLMIIVGCMVVTALPRILPFMMMQRVQLPQVALRWLSYIPVCILTALIVESALIQSEGQVAFDKQVLLAILPTLATAVLSKSLLATVAVGILTMAVLRALPFFTL